MSNPAALLHQALTYHQAGQWPEAESAYRQCLSHDERDATALRLLGGLYLQNGLMGAALSCLERAIAFGQNDHETRYNAAVAATGRGRELAADGRTDDAARHFYQAVLWAPDYRDAYVEMGITLSQSGRGAKAQPWLTMGLHRVEATLADTPNHTYALNQKGNLLQELGHFDEAENCYRHILAQTPYSVAAWVNLGTCLRNTGQFAKAEAAVREAIKHNPDAADLYLNLGVYLQDLSRHAEAIAAFDQSLRLQPDSRAAQWNKGFSCLALGRYAEGWALHDVGLGIDSMRGKYPYPERLWQGEQGHGQRLLIWCEQGLGDDLQFIRYTRLCRDRGFRVIVQCPSPLRRLFANDPAIDYVTDHVEDDDFDLHIPMMSLPFAFGTTLESIPSQFPYLHISDSALRAWRGRMAPVKGFKVGLVWAGNPRIGQRRATMIDARRSLHLEQLRPLFDVPHVTFYNLQIGDKAAQIDACGLRDHVIDMMGDVQDMEDTAAIIQNLDLVITVDTSVAHLAGGLGKPVWILSRYDACWRWLDNQPTNPWYPSARIFGQPNPGEWGPVIDFVAQALRIVSA